MLNAMKNDGDGEYEKLDFLFWKARDQKFVMQPRGGTKKDAVDLPEGSRIEFFPSTIQTGWVKWSNKVPDFKNDTIAGVDEPHPDPEHKDYGTKDDPWKRFFNIVVEISGERKSFSGESGVSNSALADLLCKVAEETNITLESLEETGLSVLPDFLVHLDGVREFDSAGGLLAAPVWTGLTIADAAKAPEIEEAEKKTEELEEDEIPF